VFVALVAAGVRVPGVEVARAVASRLLCAAALAERCGDEPVLIAAYGDEVGRLVARHMPALLFERGSKALPVDFRRCRASACGDGSARGLVDRTDTGLPVTAFVRVVDCRGSGEAAPDDESASGTDTGSGRDDLPVVAGFADCSGPRAGNLYLQYWFFYVDSATLRGVPVAGKAGYHRDDWESLQIRIRPGGQVDSRASSHHGYNHARSVVNAGSDAGWAPVRAAAEAVRARPRNGWGPAAGTLLVSGGSHAGNVEGFPRIDRLTPGRQVHLVPLEPIATGAGAAGHRFAVSPPWRKHAWRDPEAPGTD
ncbi:MAG TPA: hypothetical protein VFC52_05170, partial [Solirubrobacterales bacterium]|nr:hypothetical protein [Solirubrobacterales bacterium]